MNDLVDPDAADSGTGGALGGPKVLECPPPGLARVTMAMSGPQPPSVEICRNAGLGRGADGPVLRAEIVNRGEFPVWIRGDLDTFGVMVAPGDQSTLLLHCPTACGAGSTFVFSYAVDRKTASYLLVKDLLETYAPGPSANKLEPCLVDSDLVGCATGILSEVGKDLPRRVSIGPFKNLPLSSIVQAIDPVVSGIRYLDKWKRIDSLTTTGTLTVERHFN